MRTFKKRGGKLKKIEEPKGCPVITELCPLGCEGGMDVHSHEGFGKKRIWYQCGWCGSVLEDEALVFKIKRRGMKNVAKRNGIKPDK